jgi:murein DD-endopeptidase MepM/ murein hydrolase activator NlpD
MDPQILLRKPKPVPKVTAKISKIDSLKLVSEETKKSSIKLRKIFESGSYQKKTQLSILKRYKKKLDTLEKNEEERQRKLRQRSKKKFQPAKIKKFTGSFFTPNASDNPLKAIGLLAAFNAVDRASQKDFSGMIGPALVASGLLFGPKLLSLGMARFGKGKPLPQSTTATPTPTKPPLNPSSLSRANQSYSKFISGQANIGDKSRLVRRGYITPKQAFSKGGPQALAATQPGKVSKAFAKFGGSIIPGVGAVVGATDSVLRAQSGDVTGSAIAGTAAALDAYAAASAATVVGLPLAGLASIASFTLDVVNLVRDLTGTSAAEEAKNKDKLKEQTKEQKELVAKQKEETQQLTFSKTLNSYEKSIKKFEEFSKNFKFGMGVGTNGEQVGTIETGNTAIPTGENLQDIEATGGEVPGKPDSPYGPRNGKQHQGNDYFRSSGTPISVVQSGTVTVADMNYDPSGWGAVVEIRHQDGSLSRYAHLSEINVAAGTSITPGQVIGKTGGAAGSPGSGNSEGPHLHFEYETASGRIDPTAIAPKIFRFGGNVKVKQKTQDPSQQSPSPSSPAGVQDLRSIQKTLSGRSIPFEVDGKKYFFKIRPDGTVEAFKPKNLIGYQEEIDITNGNTFIKKAIAKKIKSMFPASTPAAQMPAVTRPSPAIAPAALPLPRQSISQTMSYEQPSPYSSPDPIIVPIQIPPTPKPRVMSSSQEPSVMMMSGPSEEELLNSFYKRVLLNTLI